jgi:L-lysine 2,3-aminomutase
MLEEYNEKKQIYLVTQFDHPREITPESIRAVKELIRRGIVVRNQTVLMRGVNDSVKVLSELLRGLTVIGVVPYYIFQCRPVAGLAHRFQVPLMEGAKIVDEARYGQNGQGKSMRFVMSHYSGKIEIVGIADGTQLVMKYHNAKDPADRNRLFMIEPEPDQCWLD